MKWVKIYEDYNEIKRICDQYHIRNWTLNSNGEIDVDSRVDLSQENLTNERTINELKKRGYNIIY